MRPSPLLSPEQIYALLTFLFARYKAVVREKGEAVEMQVVAHVFGVARLFGANLPTEAEFMTRFWTTLGPVIYAPQGHQDLAVHWRVLAHELMHVVQFWADPLSYLSRYLTERGRAEIEARSERAAIELEWIFCGTLPADLDALRVTRHGYGVSDGHVDLTQDLLETSCTSVATGVLSTDIGIAAYEWMMKHYPDKRVGMVLTVQP